MLRRQTKSERSDQVSSPIPHEDLWLSLRAAPSQRDRNACETSALILNCDQTKLLATIRPTNQTIQSGGEYLIGTFARHLTIRLSDAGLRQRQTEALDPDHPFPPWLTEGATPRSLEPLVR